MSKRERNMRRSAAALEQESAEGIEESQLRRLLTNTIDTIEDNKTQIFKIRAASWSRRDSGSSS